MQKLIIKHLKGSKANQVEFFDLPVSEILLGRDPAARIVFDPIKDDLVSRRHLKITQEGDDKFTLTDLDSRNGNFIHRIKVAGATRLQSGDVIQLGEGGPQFLLDLDPRPENVPGATRIVAAPPATPMTRERRIESAAGSNEAVGPRPTAIIFGRLWAGCHRRPRRWAASRLPANRSRAGRTTWRSPSRKRSSEFRRGWCACPIPRTSR